MHWSVWITGSIILFVFEMLTPGGFFFACLGTGALVTAVCSIFPVAFWAQWVIFTMVSLVSIYTLRPFAKKYLKAHEKKSNVDALIGKKAQITEAINPPALGLIKIEGEVWRAEAPENIEKGALVEVVAVEGTRLKVRKT